MQLEDKDSWTPHPLLMWLHWCRKDWAVDWDMIMEAPREGLLAKIFMPRQVCIGVSIFQMPSAQVIKTFFRNPVELLT